MYFGLQFSRQCFCGERYGRYGRSKENECNYDCAGDSTQLCGSRYRNSVWKYIRN